MSYHAARRAWHPCSCLECAPRQACVLSPLRYSSPAFESGLGYFLGAGIPNNINFTSFLPPGVQVRIQTQIWIYRMC